MLKNDASAAYRKKIINFRYACRKYYRHVCEDRGRAIDLLQHFPVIANRLILSLSFSLSRGFVVVYLAKEMHRKSVEIGRL